MWQTLLINLKLHLREKTQLFWLFAFPIILATMFNGMFGNIAESFELHTLDVAVVEDNAWKTSYGAQTLIEGISSESSALSDNHVKVSADGKNGTGLINTTKVESIAQAEQLLADGTAQGMLRIDDGRLRFSVSQSTQSSVSDVMASSSGLDISLTVLGNIVDLYNRNTDVVVDIAKHNPEALMNGKVTGSIGSANGYTKEIQLTNFKPSGTARYYYALLGLAALMAMSFAINVVTMTQANLSALGVRRSVSPLPKSQQLLAGFLSSWLCSFLSLTVAMLYIRFVCHISLGGREWAGVGACLMASFAASAFEQELSGILRARRKKRGSIDFDFPETKMILDENGKPVDIRPYDRNVATKIIEDFMLLANETVAEDGYWQELPFLYRSHETPDEEKIRTLATFINNFGYSMHIGVNEIRPKEIQKLLTKVEDTPEEAMISRLALRSMKQAKYTVENDGHFGLAANYYTHFTSPIRRYPDLQIHRIIKDNLRGRMNADKMEHYRSILPEVAKRSSEMERRADEAERETVKLKKVEYMQAHIGEEFEGVISGITKWGMYVELPNTIEGLVHVTNMTDDHYEYNEERYEMMGMHTRKVYKLGEGLRVRVLDADRLMRTIDFKIVNQGGAGDGEE